MSARVTPAVEAGATSDSYGVNASLAAGGSLGWGKEEQEVHFKVGFETALTGLSTSLRPLTIEQLRTRDDFSAMVEKSGHSTVAGGQERVTDTGRHKAFVEITPRLSASTGEWFGDLHIGLLLGGGYQWTPQKHDVAAIVTAPKQHEEEKKGPTGESIHKVPIPPPSWTTTDSVVLAKSIESGGLFGRFGVIGEWRPLANLALVGKGFYQIGATSGWGWGFGLTFYLDPISQPTLPPPKPDVLLAHMRNGGVVIKKRKINKATYEISVSLIKKGLDWKVFEKNIIPHKIFQYLPESVPVSYEIPLPGTAEERHYYLVTHVISKVGPYENDYPAIVHARLGQKEGRFYCEWDTKDVKGEAEDSKIRPEVRTAVTDNIELLRKAMGEAKQDTSGKRVEERLALIFNQFEENVHSIQGSYHYDTESGRFDYSLTSDVVMPNIHEELFEKLAFGPAVITARAVVGDAPVILPGTKPKMRTVNVMVIREAGDPLGEEERKEMQIPVASQ